LIHASAKFDKEQERLAFEFSQLLKDSRVYHCDRGAIIGQVKLVGTHPTSFYDFAASAKKIGVNWEQEREFGDY
jgi:hypothetical protein